jgi:hypothetical protein
MRTAMSAGIVFFSVVLAAASGPTPEEAKKNFTASWRFYEWRVEQGDALEELESILQRILRKYAESPVSLGPVQEELDAVRSLQKIVQEE